MYGAHSTLNTLRDYKLIQFPAITMTHKYRVNFDLNIFTVGDAKISFGNE